MARHLIHNAEFTLTRTGPEEMMLRRANHVVRISLGSNRLAKWLVWQKTKVTAWGKTVPAPCYTARTLDEALNAAALFLLPVDTGEARRELDLVTGTTFEQDVHELVQETRDDLAALMGLS